MTTPTGRGGPRTPERGAPVSGPGPLSRRTDGPQGGQPVRVPTGGGYGEGAELAALQEAAPLAESPGPQGGFGDPSAQLDTPVTAGAALGAGPGPEALGLPQQADEDMQRLLASLPALERMANAPGASRAARNWVRAVKAHAPPRGFDGLV